MALALLEGQLGAGTAHPAHHHLGGIGAACPVPRLLGRGGAQRSDQLLHPYQYPPHLPCACTVTRACPWELCHPEPLATPCPHLTSHRTPCSSDPTGIPLTWRAWLAKPSPSCLQTTMASLSPHCAPHTAPHCSCPCTGTSTSTTPSSGLRPPARRIYGQRGDELQCGAGLQVPHPAVQWDRQPHASR